MQQAELLNVITGTENDGSSLKHRLIDLTIDYPWFGAPHYFLLQQMDKTEAGYPKLAAKTALHFSNPYLLQYSLNDFYTGANDESIVDQTVITTTSEFHQDDFVKEETETVVEPAQEATEEKVDTEEIAVQDEIATTNEDGEIEPPVSTSTSDIAAEEITPIENKQEPVPQKEEMIFEPLFASDYFASQGIKLSEQETPSDKLGKQVKSFTDWLKTMKKLPGSQATQVMHVDSNVEQLAEKSNTDAEVITETMADVFLQQGRKARAIEIYHKLSLLDPSKSAYFAAKIDHLKTGDN
jgi:hypothetical protein